MTIKVKEETPTAFLSEIVEREVNLTNDVKEIENLKARLIEA